MGISLSRETRGINGFVETSEKWFDILYEDGKVVLRFVKPFSAIKGTPDFMRELARILEIHADRCERNE